MRHRVRRGLTVLVVLALISITLALSYAMMRAQTVSSQIQGNAVHRDGARQAALAGLAIALRKMHEPDWAGVAGVVAGNLSPTDSYRVTYRTGDASLVPGHPDYEEYPFRVTLSATGYSVDADNPGIRAEHHARAVVQLVRRQFSTEPDTWQQLQRNADGTPYTVCQWDNVRVPVNVPVRVEGAVRLQGPLEIGADYDWVDNRPFDGQIDEVAVFRRALSEAELRAIYAARTSGSALAAEYAANSPYAWWRLDETTGSATAADRAGSHDGVYVGADPGDAGLPYDGSRSARFDGHHDYVDLGRMDISGSQFTLAGWFQAGTFEGHTDARIISKATGTAVSEHYWMLGTCLKDAHIRLRFRLKTTAGTTQLEASSGDIPTGKWVFAAAVYDGNEMRLYQDGNLVGATNKSGALATNSHVSAWIGDNPPGSIRARYLRDLERMRAAGDGDYRPLTGPLYLPRNLSQNVDLDLVEDDLNVAIHDTPAGDATPPAHPGAIERYRLYPGGQEYEIPRLPYDLSSATYAPDPQQNPLGIFRCPGTLCLNGNVSITGTVVTSDGGDLRVQGDNVHLEAAPLPALDGGGPTELPVAIVADDIRVDEPQQAEIRGLAMAWDDFELRAGSESAGFSLHGRLIVRELLLHGRSEWDVSAFLWSSVIKQFMAQFDDPIASGHSPYLPRWIGNTTARQPEPRVTIAPDPAAPAYHWPAWDQPIYVPHADDEGLVWDVIEWSDNP